MKMFKRLVLTLCVVYTAITLINGCASPNPNAGQKTVIVNPDGTFTTNTAPQYIPNTTGTQVVGYAKTAAPFIPAPYGDILTLAAGIATVVMTKISNNKNAQLTAVVQGVEDSTSGTGSIDPQSVKEAIQKRAVATGIQPALDATVQKLT